MARILQTFVKRCQTLYCRFCLCEGFDILVTVTIDIYDVAKA
jgi:hypothetical protein